MLASFSFSMDPPYDNLTQTYISRASNVIDQSPLHVANLTVLNLTCALNVDCGAPYDWTVDLNPKGYGYLHAYHK